MASMDEYDSRSTIGQNFWYVSDTFSYKKNRKLYKVKQKQRTHEDCRTLQIDLSDMRRLVVVVL